MELIVAVDRAGGIGRDGGMLYHLPEDLRRFKRLTMGKTLLMGKGTFFSLPGRKALPGRINCVLSSQARLLQAQYPAGEFGPFFYQNMEDFLRAHASEEIMVMGGESVYRQCMPLCRIAHVTEIDAVREADTRFALAGDWVCVHRENMRENGMPVSFCTYENRKIRGE